MTGYIASEWLLRYTHYLLGGKITKKSEPISRETK